MNGDSKETTGVFISVNPVSGVINGFSICAMDEQAVEAVETVLEIMKSNLEKGDDVMLSGFGKFKVSDKKPRVGRNPRTGEEIMIDARKVVTFKPSGKLRGRVNGE